jgi:hypothetical protein
MTISTTATTVASTIVASFGATGSYKNQSVLVRGLTKDGKKVQLLDLDTGANLIGCPSVGKVAINGSLPVGVWNGIEYAYSFNTDTLYAASGVVFKDRSNAQRLKLIAEVFTPETVLQSSGLSFGDLFSIEGSMEVYVMTSESDDTVSGVDILTYKNVSFSVNSTFNLIGSFLVGEFDGETYAVCPISFLSVSDKGVCNNPAVTRIIGDVDQEDETNTFNYQELFAERMETEKFLKSYYGNSAPIVEPVINPVVEEIIMPVSENVCPVNSIVEEIIMSVIEKPKFTPVSKQEEVISKYFRSYNAKDISDYAAQTNGYEAVTVKYQGSIRTIKDGKYDVFNVNKMPTIGIYTATKFIIEKENFDNADIELVLSNIHVVGVRFDYSRKIELFAMKIAIAMHSSGIGYAKIMEGLKKGYKIFSRKTVIERGNDSFTVMTTASIPSVGPLGEGSTIKFVNPNIPSDTVFGENVMDDEGNVGRLVFEKPNKVVAREMKLGAGKTDGVTYLGNRAIILVDEALNPKGLSATVKRMLVLGTAWVSGEEYEHYGSVRTIPMKSVTAPIPSAIGSLRKGQMLVGGNTHKSKLNGVLYHALGMSHSEISQLDEKQARELLIPFITYIKLNGRSYAAYKFDLDIYATNFYSLYSLEISDARKTEEYQDESEVKSFFLDALEKVRQSAVDGTMFNLRSHIEDAIKSEEMQRKAHKTEVTSAEVQQVAISYGYEAAQSFVDNLLTKRNVKSKFFMFENVKDLPKITRDELFDLARDTYGDTIEPTIVPKEFVLGFYNLVGDESKGFVVSCNGYDFPFAPIGNVKFKKDGTVKDAPSSLVSLLTLAISVRNSYTDWAAKYANHMAELNGEMIKKVQTLDVKGAYLAAVSGFWLNPTDVFSPGDLEGKVTSAKLPILFDQAITGLNNQSGSDSVYTAEELIRYAPHFDRICFVSPEYFLSQENDGDGDLVKIMVGFDSIPVWSGQPDFCKGKMDDYIKGEYEGLKLSLKPYSLMPFELFHKGNLAAKVAKDNVALMAANEYRVKQSMLPFLTSGTYSEMDLAKMVAEASAYLVQYEAMRAAKHDGAVSMYEKVRCAPAAELVPSCADYINNWADLLKDYFGYEAKSHYSYVLLHKILADLYEGKYNGLVPGAYNLEAFVDGGMLSGSTFAYGIQQKGYARAVGLFTGKFRVPAGKKAEELKALNEAAVAMFKRGGMYSCVYNGTAARVARSISFDSAAVNGDIFAYTLKTLALRYAKLKLPTPPKGETFEEVTPTITNSTEEVVMSVVETVESVDSIAVWTEVSKGLVLVSDGTISANKRMVKLKRSIMNACLDTNVYALALAEAESHVLDYMDWAEEYRLDKELDALKTQAMELAAKATDSVVMPVDNCVKVDKTVEKTVEKASTRKFEAANNGSKRLEGRDFSKESLEDLSSADFRSMRYYSRAASFEATVNNTHPVKKGGNVTSSKVQSASFDFAAYAAFMASQE